MDVKEKKGKKARNRPLSEEVDLLVGNFEADEDGALVDEDFAKNRKKQKRRSARRKLLRGLLLVLLALLILGAVAVMEPWVAPAEEPSGEPALEKLAPATLAVGDTYTFDIALDANERISSVEVSDPALLQAGENSVTALGEYFQPVTATVTTMEIEVPAEEPAHELVIGVRDFSEPLNNMRSFLRDLFGIEKRKPQRTELLQLRRFECEVSVEGLGSVTDTAAYEAEAYLQHPVALLLSPGEGESLRLSSLNEATAVISGADTGGEIRIEGLALGSTKLLIEYGFTKAVDAETYASYLEYLAAAGREPEGEQNAVFVPTRAVEIPIKVIDLDEIVVSTELEEEDEADYVSDYSDGLRSAFAEEILELINGERAARGLAALEWSEELAETCEDRSRELAESFTASAAEGARGELVAAGPETARAALNIWLASPQTRALVLDEDASAFGCALYRDGDTDCENFWCARTA
ncbi:MAG: CAP domain-containing protein [Oscillospiraceae bacterium]|nr:CAP domain-containing protein [Oscillospiraceae bacterium]